MQSIIGFISDFGLEDTWVGVCHAVIYRACPQAQVVDLGHQIPPFDIRKAAAMAVAGVHQLPEAIHLVVVDPGVGGGRRDLCIVTCNGTRLVGPDNGVLVPAALRAGGVEAAYAINPTKIDFKQPLATFHARDVLAPAAAALACGIDASSLGAPVDPGTLVPGPFESAHVEDGQMVAEVIESDRFGSLRIAVSKQELQAHGLWGERLELGFRHLSIDVPLARTFTDVQDGNPVALVDSSGWLTLAVRMGDASERYGIEPGAAVRIGVPS
ncbi:MAG: SAM-dependent chlorinase/fluorinase [Actinomycetota bacterium]|nr:SAM-dependent chlorinase/fluorinase [Actinomycetota bacterium]